MKDNKRAVYLFSVLLIGIGGLRAQNPTSGEIRGTIFDHSGAVMPGVHVAATNTLTNITTAKVSDSGGAYVFPDLPPGVYDLAFEHPGFKSETRRGINLLVGDAFQFNVTLEIGSVADSLTVTVASGHLDLESSERSTEFTSDMITELPIVGRNQIDLLGLVPGASYGAAIANGQTPGDTPRISISGQRSYSTGYQLDGSFGTYAQSYNGGPQPSLDSIAEVRVSTNNFSAEYGGGGSVFSVVTKSGTNQFHGALWEFNQNTALNAKNYFAASRVPVHWNQFGGDASGPIMHQRMFFFFSYQHLISLTPVVYLSTVPTTAMLQGDYSARTIPVIYDPASTTGTSTARQAFPGNIIPTSRLDPVAVATGKYWPAPTQSGFINNYFDQGDNRATGSTVNGKWDYYLSPSNRITGTGVYAPSVTTYFGAIPGPACINANSNCGTSQGVTWGAAINDTWTISAGFLNQFRLGFFLSDSYFIEPAAGMNIPQKLGLKGVPPDTFPLISVTGFIQTNLEPGTSFNLRQVSYVPSDTATWVHGKHVIKFGTELQKLQVNNIQPWLSSGNFNFGGSFTTNGTNGTGGLGMADFSLGMPGSYSLSKAPDLGERSWLLQTFIQDDYKILPNLTLNLGLRHEARSGWSEVNDQNSNFDPALLNPVTNTLGAISYAGKNGWSDLTSAKYGLFAPRLGLAWAPLPKTSVRAGYGIFYLPFSADTFSNQSPAGFSISQTIQSPNSNTPIFALQNGPPPYTPPSAANRTAGSLNGSALTYHPTSIREAYTQQWYFGIQRQVTSSLVLDTSYVGTAGSHLPFPRDMNQPAAGPGNGQLRRPFPQYQSINEIYNDGSSIYHSLQVAARQNVTKSLMLTVSYVFSKGIDNSSYDHTIGIGNTWQIASRPDLARGLSLTDMPQRAVASLVYQLPLGKGKALLNRGGILDTVLGGWQSSAIFVAQSGIPFTPTVSNANLSGALSGTWLPNRLSNGNLPGGQRTIHKWFNTGAFVIPSQYTFGNSGRDILRGPGFVNLNFGLMKSFPIPWLKEGPRLQLRADASNILNHPNFFLPNAAIGASVVGTITSATASRAMQLGMKLSF